MEHDIVKPKLERNWPMTPGMNATGANTTTSERVVAVTARPTSSVAARAASIGPMSFSSTKRKMFSSTTMASSMTMPTASVSASMVSQFRLKPSAFMRVKVAITEHGMATAEITVARQLPMKRNTTTLASSAPTIRCFCTSASDMRMKRAWSRVIATSTPAGRPGRICSRRRVTASTVATVFAPDCLRTSSVRPLRPL